MFPAHFDYHRPNSLEAAIALLGQGEDTKVLAGGHSLVPAMKFRLAQPRVLVDISRIAGLNYIREESGAIAIGAMTTHYQIESSELLRKRCPLLPEVAVNIGDVQVRNKGTLAGSVVHADPAADWPAAILALDAEIAIVGPNGKRTVKAADFFVDMMQTAVQSNEIVSEIRVPMTDRTVAYAKFAQKASGFAIAGVAAVVDRKNKNVRVGITGIAAKPYRAGSVEAALAAQSLTSDRIATASAKAAEGVEPLNDIHASAEYRLHLARLNTQRALEIAVTRA